MKKLIVFLLALIFFCSLASACPSNGVEILAPTNSQASIAYLTLGEMNWGIEGEKIFYEPDLNAPLGAMIENGKISFLLKQGAGQSVSSIDWTGALLTELTRLNAMGVISLTPDDIIEISELGCCGTISLQGAGWVKDSKNCSETAFVLPVKNTSFNWIGILVAIIPALIVFFYFGFYKKSIIPAFVFGVIGFLVAFFLRYPILMVLQTAFPSLSQEFGFIVFVIVAASALAGLFEEGFRYLFFKKIPIARANKRNVLAFGLGWGFIEMLLLYAINMIAYIFFLNYPVSFTDSLVGAVERNLAILFHLGATFIVFKAIVSNKKKFLWLAMFLHFILDLSAVTIGLTGNVLLAEIDVLIIGVITVLIAWKLMKKES